eukprot:717993-Hanusia_phi.AAC.16
MIHDFTGAVTRVVHPTWNLEHLTQPLPPPLPNECTPTPLIEAHLCLLYPHPLVARWAMIDHPTTGYV